MPSFAPPVIFVPSNSNEQIEKTKECKKLISNYQEYWNPTKNQMQSYAECVNYLYPKEREALSPADMGVLLVTLLCFVFIVYYLVKVLTK